MTYNFDPELAPYLDLLPTVTLEDLAAARAGIGRLADLAPPVDESGVEFADRTIPGPADHPELGARVYRPREAAAAPAPGICYIHGGGFVLGSVELEHAGCVRLATALGAVVVSVEYRLAPEHPFPAAIDDCYAALSWLHAEAPALRVDPGRIAVVGNSAGGGLAAGVALMARDRGGPPICFQYLGIPELDDRLDTPSMTQFVDSPVWNRPNAVISWRHYLGDDPGEVSPYAAPARAGDLAGLPPAYVSTMEFDPLRDEGIHYAGRLMQAGVSCELHCYPGTWHGSSMIPTASVNQRGGREMLEVLGKALGPAPTPPATLSAAPVSAATVSPGPRAAS